MTIDFWTLVSVFIVAIVARVGWETIPFIVDTTGRYLQ